MLVGEWQMWLVICHLVGISALIVFSRESRKDGDGHDSGDNDHVIVIPSKLPIHGVWVTVDDC